jgi:hypothetical protein
MTHVIIVVRGGGGAAAAAKRVTDFTKSIYRVGYCVCFCPAASFEIHC